MNWPEFQIEQFDYTNFSILSNDVNSIKNSLLPNEQLLIDWQTFIHPMIWNIFCDVPNVGGSFFFFLLQFVRALSTIYILCRSLFSSLLHLLLSPNLKQYSLGILNHFHYLLDGKKRNENIKLILPFT